MKGVVVSNRPAPNVRQGLGFALSLVLGLGILVGIPVAVIVATPQTAHASVASGEIAFVRHSTSGIVVNKLAIRHSNGSVTDILTLDSNDYDAVPVVSPDGSQIAFWSRRFCYGSCGAGIMVVNSDGSNLQALTTPSSSNVFVDWYPSWSPDGQWLAFREDVGSNPPQIKKIQADGTSESTVSQDSTKIYDHPAWSPNTTGTQKIAFSRYGGADAQIYTMNTDGSSETAVPSQPSRYNDEVVFDPSNSSRLYFHSMGYGGYSFIYGIDTNGSNLVQVASPGYEDPESPTVSPDGSKVSYYLFPDLYEANTDGTGSEIDLTSSSGNVNLSPAYVSATWPPVPPSNATVAVNAATAHDAPYTRQITVGLSAAGNKWYDYGWSTSSTVAPTSNLQRSTDMVNRNGVLNYMGIEVGSTTTWNGGTQPGQNWYLWVRSVQTNGTINAWGTPLLVHTPRRPVWVGVGDSYSSGHHQDSDEPWCPNQSDTGFPETYINCPAGGLDLTPNDLNYSWVKKAVDSYNTALHAPTDPTTGWSYGLDLVAASGAWTSSFGVAETTPGTDEWASGTAQSYSIRSDLYGLYDSWPVVSMTGGANDTNWADKLSDFYKRHFTELSPVAPWAVSTSDPSTDCPDSQSVWNWLKANQLDGRTLDAHIQTNLQGIVTVATRYSSGVRVINMGYPYMVNAANSCSADSGSWHGSKSVIDDLNAVHTAVTGANVHYISLTAATGFGPNPIAAGDLQLRRLYGYPHPVDTGQTVMANISVSNLSGAW